MRKAILVAAGFLSIAMAHPAKAAQPSFNCNYAKTPDEVLICENDNLANLDVAMANYFYDLRNRVPPNLQRKVDATQSIWLNYRWA